MSAVMSSEQAHSTQGAAWSRREARRRSSSARSSGRRSQQRRGRGLWSRLFRRTPRVAGTSAVGRLGWTMPGGGGTVIFDAPPEFRAPTVQVCGLYPFSAGGTLPMIGAALGPHMEGRGVVCGDPVSWFVHGLINNPSAFVLGRPGLGKSSLVRHILAQLPDKGIIPLVLSDRKGEHVWLVRALNGQVIAPGRGREYVNPLDLGPLAGQLQNLPEEQRRAAIADMESRRQNTMAGLCELALGRRLEAHEKTALNGAILGWAAENPGETPVASDLLVYVQSRPEPLMEKVQARGDTARYDTRTEYLVDALLALSGEGIFGDVFAHQTTNPLQMHRPAVFDLSAVDAMDQTLQAGLQLVCWSYGSAAVTAAKYLADAGQAPRRTYCMLMDELWMALRAAEFMVDRVDEITRLNRTLNLAQVLITHTMNDLKLATPDATAKAFEFVSRSEIVYLGGLAPGEMGNLKDVFAMSRKEQDLLASWSTPGRVNPTTGKADAPAGRGKFLLKVGKDVGAPFQVQLTPAEQPANETNVNWQDTIDSMRGERVDLSKIEAV